MTAQERAEEMVPADAPDRADRIARTTRCLIESGMHAAEREASFERCDTDGFLSQWASGLGSSKAQAQAQIEADGGRSEFPALFRNGELIAAKQVETKYGTKWGVLESDDPRSRIVEWFAPTARAARQHGYTQGRVMARATAKFEGRGYGLSGTCWVAVVRTDGGFSRDVVVTAINEEE